MNKIALLFLLSLLLPACTPSLDKTEEKTVKNFGKEVTVNKTGMLYTVSPEKISPVLPFRGNIPPITEPKYIKAAEASFLKEDDEVIGFIRGGVKKAYPVKIMRWHAIVSEEIGGEALMITYDPLSRLGLAYKRRVLDKAITFKASDKIYNANPLLTDKETKSLWSQYTGKCVLGRLAGQELEAIPVMVSSWSDWKKSYPETEVLSLETGYRREYGKNVYSDFYSNEFIPFEVEHEDKRIKNKEEVYGIVIGSSAKAYRQGNLKKGSTLSDAVGGINFTLSVDANGIVSARKDGGREEIVVRKAFWFSWAAFQPETEIYGM
ncbi:MAG: DUF3179 domain-containing protein [Deltaproteobacteria bacterium]|nr:DUF3179 domain-containing protein [Deltaproteobacteria bacterium]